MITCILWTLIWDSLYHQVIDMQFTCTCNVVERGESHVICMLPEQKNLMTPLATINISKHIQRYASDYQRHGTRTGLSSSRTRMRTCRLMRMRTRTRTGLWNSLRGRGWGLIGLSSWGQFVLMMTLHELAMICILITLLGNSLVYLKKKVKFSGAVLMRTLHVWC